MNRFNQNFQKARNFLSGKKEGRSQSEYSSTASLSDKTWLGLNFFDQDQNIIKKPDQLERDMRNPPAIDDPQLLDRIQGSMIGMTIGDALGAHVEFRTREYLLSHPVSDFEGGGTWGLEKGQFTDDTSMALCLASSLVSRRGFNLYDQLVRYKWWYRYGYMSSTGECFDIGTATRESLQEFEQRQDALCDRYPHLKKDIDYPSNDKVFDKFDVYCSGPEVAGNGALMRLAPVPLFFYRYPEIAVKYSGKSGKITHGDRKAYDACRYYGALIVAALKGYSKEQLLSSEFYSTHKQWFGDDKLSSEVKAIAKGSFKKRGGYDEGIRGKGYIVAALEAALWAFWSDRGSFKEGALLAVNLGDDTDTTAAIYGQLAGAYYGLKSLPPEWVQQIYAKNFILNLSSWIAFEGSRWEPSKRKTSMANQTSVAEPLGSSHERNPQPAPGETNLSHVKLRATVSVASGEDLYLTKKKSNDDRDYLRDVQAASPPGVKSAQVQFKLNPRDPIGYANHQRIAIEESSMNHHPTTGYIGVTLPTSKRQEVPPPPPPIYLSKPNPQRYVDQQGFDPPGRPVENVVYGDRGRCPPGITQNPNVPEGFVYQTYGRTPSDTTTNPNKNNYQKRR